MLKDVEPLLKECEETLAELMRMGNMEVACYVQGFINSINKLPEAEQRPHGEWTINGNDLEYICSVCGEVLPYSDEYDYKTNFCPNCGAPMTEEALRKYNGLKEGDAE